MRILLTNDDGVNAPGLQALRNRLQSMSDVTIVAPDRERSAVSHALTLRNPIRFKKIENHVFSVDGTPADAVFIALTRIMKDEMPSLVISGINRGANVGDDVFYSGTVAGAREAAMHGVQSFAISSAAGQTHNFALCAEFAARLVAFVSENNLPEREFLNVNIPEASKGANCPDYRFTQLGQRVYEDEVVKNVDPRGMEYYWIGGQGKTTQKFPNTDVETISLGLISITPLTVDHTAHGLLTKLRETRIAK